MAIFEYKAIDIDAKKSHGGFEARDAQDAMQKLRERNLFVISVKEKKIKKQRFIMNSKQLAEFCKELSLMLNSGLPMIKALNVIASGENTDKKVKNVYSELHKSLKIGMSLSDAMKEQGKTFPELIINMFYSGEVSGTLSNVSDKMAAYYMAEYKLRKKISQASVYPKVLCFLIVAVLFVVFLFVLPNMMDMLEGQKLPAITQFMKDLSDYVKYKWYNVLLFTLALFLVVTYLKSVRLVWFYWHKTIIQIPKIGSLLRTIYTARFARTLSSLYSSGVQLITAIGVSSKIIGNYYIEGQFPDIIKRIKQGEVMSTVLAEADGFSEKLQNILVIGEETGKLDEILDFAANSFEYDADAAIASLLGMMEPILLIVVAVVVCLVVVSVILPVFQMYETIGSYGGL